jgi:hypothetical protein
MSEIKSVRSKTIVRFEIPELNENKIEAKFMDTGGESVKEYLTIYQDGDDRYNIIALMLQVMELRDSYKCWSKAGKAKKLANTMKQALNGKGKKKWTEITNKRTAWNIANMREKCYKMLQKLRKEIFGTRACKKQVEAMEDGPLKLSEEQDLRDSIDKLFAINREIPSLGTGGEELSGLTLNKILIKIFLS